MIKLLILVRRKPGLSHEEFVEHHRGRHAEVFTSQPEVQRYVRRYVQSHPAPGEISGRTKADFDGTTEMWFDDMDGLNGVFDSDNYKKNVVSDEKTFIDRANGLMMIVKENVVLS